MTAEWTEEQKKVIDHRGRSLLVSAAAGSGKTAVLVERIVRMVTDPDHPVDIDRLLVVTFTRAAAGEMRGRLQDALEKKLAADPENEHLQRQGVLIHHAQITTIHGFCNYVIQNYFQRISLDPGYRIAKEGELKLLREDVMDRMLEEEYSAEDNGDFIRFIRTFGAGRNDEKAAELIGQVFDFSMSHPYPDEWLDRCLEIYSNSTEDSLASSAWVKNLTASAQREIADALEAAEELCERASGAEELAGSRAVLFSDCEKLRALLQTDSFSSLREKLLHTKFDRWKGAKTKKLPDMVKLAAELKAARDSAVKPVVRNLSEGIFSSSLSKLAEDLSFMQPCMAELVRLVRKFTESFAEEKRERNIVDFSDLEHLALSVLEEKDASGRAVRTDAAKELASVYVEVMTDEYQDSSALQEAVLRDVSGEEDGRHDRFMVGDVKQSSYGFRMARPSLFMEKFRTYREIPDAGGDRIDLSRNFRSRPEVLDTVNAFFRRMMIPEVGGISYDASQALYPGHSSYPALPDAGFPETELLLVCREREAFGEIRNREDRVALEAQAAGTRILSMVNGRTCIRDAGTGELRPVHFRDCVILLRSSQGWADTYVKTLQELGIPAYTPAKSGYFSAPEVRLVLDVLTVLDNPEQDIPYAAVMRSPIGRFTDREMAEIRAACPKGTYYYAVQQYAGAGADEAESTGADADETEGTGADADETEGTGADTAEAEYAGAGVDEAEGAGADTAEAEYAGAGVNESADQEAGLREKCVKFCAMLKAFRERAFDTPVHTLIEEILRETGYEEYAAAMPAGRQRQANLSMLVQKAVEYEATSYHGVFNFVRYIEKLQKYQVDEGEAGISAEDEDTVRVMTIHASKGLEFPVVIIGGLGKQFNEQDEKGTAVLDADLGVGLKKIDPDRRTKGETLLRFAVRKKKKDDLYGEELRILYVAMTRAEQKLILLGSVDRDEDMEKIFRKQREADQMRDLGNGAALRTLHYDELIRAKSYLDWITLAMPDDHIVKIHEVTPEEMAATETRERLSTADAVAELDRRTDPGMPDADHTEDGQDQDHGRNRPAGTLEAFLDARDAFCYPYARAAELPAKMTVTEIKKRSVEAMMEERGEPLYPDMDRTAVPYIPDFMKENPDSETEGAVRGTIYHSFMEHLDYQAMSRAEDETEELQRQIRELTERGIFSEKEAACLVPEDFVRFLGTDLGKRMADAALAGGLFREKPFVLDVPAKDIDTSWPQEENILVQGTIDAYFSETGDDGQKYYVIVDYKTDRVKTRDGRDLTEKYATQLQFYRRALEQITEIPVRELWIYSVTLGRAVPVPMGAKTPRGAFSGSLQ